MTVDEYFAPVTHKHSNCPLCNSVELIQDVVPVRSPWDRLMASIRKMDADVRIITGKRIEVKEEK